MKEKAELRCKVENPSFLSQSCKKSDLAKSLIRENLVVKWGPEKEEALRVSECESVSPKQSIMSRLSNFMFTKQSDAMSPPTD